MSRTVISFQYSKCILELGFFFPHVFFLRKYIKYLSDRTLIVPFLF
uniref:Uncharacterized protein n=1 Tax=Anguilla anguilla TaxID=7936 RepID=A0A0E9XNM6_ANGAN